MCPGKKKKKSRICLTCIPLLIRKEKKKRERDGENMFGYLTIWDDYDGIFYRWM